MILPQRPGGHRELFFSSMRLHFSQRRDMPRSHLIRLEMERANEIATFSPSSVLS